MRLIIKATLLYLFLAMLVFGIGGVVIHSMVKKEVQKETDHALRTNLRLLLQSIEEGKPVDALQNRKVSIKALGPIEVENTKPVITDTMVMHLDRLEPFRQLITIKVVNGQAYHFKLMDVFIESKDMYEGVVRTMVWLYAGLGLVLLIFGFLLSRWLFKPFQQILKKIANFNLKNEKPLDFPKTGTKEFNLLSQFIKEMTTKARGDYLALKEFSENASHEMQTPIAVAKGKLELLQEVPELKSEQLELLQSAQHSLHKLSKLGQALSLLTKIENKEFSALESVDISKLVSNTWTNFEELAQLQGIDTEQVIEQGIKWKIDPVLADILVSNLLKNAIQHNKNGKWLKLELCKKALKISNPGSPLTVPTHQLFERFRKNNQSSASLGLGLAIVKKICDASDLIVDYQFRDGVHEVAIRREEERS